MYIEPVIIATRTIGAIPYYSKLQTIDMYGLNDRWVARNGVTVGKRPGHTRYTTHEYLLKSNVNLVLGPPRVKAITDVPTRDPQKFILTLTDTSLLPDVSKIIEIPLNSNYKIEVLYLKQHNFIDETLKKLNLKTYEIFR